MEVLAVCVDDDLDTESVQSTSAVNNISMTSPSSKSRRELEDRRVKPSGSELEWMNMKTRDAPASISAIHSNQTKFDVSCSDKILNSARDRSLNAQSKSSTGRNLVEGFSEVRISIESGGTNHSPLHPLSETFEKPQDILLPKSFSAPHPNKRYLAGTGSFKEQFQADACILNIDDVEDIFPEEIRKLSFSRSFGGARQQHNSLLANSGLHIL